MGFTGRSGAALGSARSTGASVVAVFRGGCWAHWCPLGLTGALGKTDPFLAQSVQLSSVIMKIRPVGQHKSAYEFQDRSFWISTVVDQVHDAIFVDEAQDERECKSHCNAHYRVAGQLQNR